MPLGLPCFSTRSLVPQQNPTVMKPIARLLLLVALPLLVSQAVAQNHPAIKVPNLSAVDSMKRTLTVIKETWPPIFSKKPLAKVSITITGTEIDDPAVEALRQALKNNKGFKRDSILFEEGVTTIICDWKEGDKSTFYTGLPLEAKAPFRIKSLNGDAVKLELRQPQTASGSTQNRP